VEVINEEHLYETIPQPNGGPESNEDEGCPPDDTSSIDDFESSDEEFPETQLPAEPPPQYNITKSLRAAGKIILRGKENVVKGMSSFKSDCFQI